MNEVRLRFIRCALLSAVMLSVVGCSRSSPEAVTLDYWKKLNEAATLRTKELGPFDSQKATADDLLLRASTLEQLPTLGVDPQAIDVGLTSAQLMREYAGLMKAGEALPAIAFAEGFFSGLTGMGDPFASTNQYGQHFNSWRGRYEAFTAKTHAVRANLTATYGIEFPSLKRTDGSDNPRENFFDRMQKDISKKAGNWTLIALFLLAAISVIVQALFAKSLKISERRR